MLSDFVLCFFFLFKNNLHDREEYPEGDDTVDQHGYDIRDCHTGTLPHHIHAEIIDWCFIKSLQCGSPDGNNYPRDEIPYSGFYHARIRLKGYIPLKEEIDNLCKQKRDLNGEEIGETTAAPACDRACSIVEYIINASVQIMPYRQYLKCRAYQRCEAEQILDERHHNHLEYGDPVTDDKKYDKLCDAGMLFLKITPETGLFNFAFHN